MTSERARAPRPDPFWAGVDAALLRSAARAPAVARATGTPCFVWQDGRIVDIGPANKADTLDTKVPGRD